MPGKNCPTLVLLLSDIAISIPLRSRESNILTCTNRSSRSSPASSWYNGRDDNVKPFAGRSVGSQMRAVARLGCSRRYRQRDVCAQVLHAAPGGVAPTPRLYRSGIGGMDGCPYAPGAAMALTGVLTIR